MKGSSSIFFFSHASHLARFSSLSVLSFCYVRLKIDRRDGGQSFSGSSSRPSMFRQCSFLLPSFSAGTARTRRGPSALFFFSVARNTSYPGDTRRESFLRLITNYRSRRRCTSDSVAREKGREYKIYVTDSRQYSVS